MKRTRNLLGTRRDNTRFRITLPPLQNAADQPAPPPDSLQVDGYTLHLMSNAGARYGWVYHKRNGEEFYEYLHRVERTRTMEGSECSVITVPDEVIAAMLDFATAQGVTG